MHLCLCATYFAVRGFWCANSKHEHTAASVWRLMIKESCSPLSWILVCRKCSVWLCSCSFIFTPKLCPPVWCPSAGHDEKDGHQTILDSDLHHTIILILSDPVQPSGRCPRRRRLQRWGTVLVVGQSAVMCVTIFYSQTRALVTAVKCFKELLFFISLNPRCFC